MDGIILYAILITIGLFIIFREIWCWYFKVNKALELLERIDRNTRKEGEVDGKTHIKYVVSKNE